MQCVTWYAIRITAVLTRADADAIGGASSRCTVRVM